MPVAGRHAQHQVQAARPSRHRRLAAQLRALHACANRASSRATGALRIPRRAAARQTLIEGGVLLVSQRPDGGLALKLNPDFAVRLSLYARVRGEPARSALLNLGDDPDLARWLLTHRLDDRASNGTRAADGCPDREPASAWRAGRRTAGRRKPASRTLTHQQTWPQNWRRRRGSFPSLPGRGFRPTSGGSSAGIAPSCRPAADCIWGQDAGTGMVYPTRWNPDDRTPDLERITGTGAGAPGRPVGSSAGGGAAITADEPIRRAP